MLLTERLLPMLLQHFPFQGFRDSGIGSQGIKNSLALMVKHKSTVMNLGECLFIQSSRVSRLAHLATLPPLLQCTNTQLVAHLQVADHKRSCNRRPRILHAGLKQR